MSENNKIIALGRVPVHRQKRVNVHFDFLYPGYTPGGEAPPDDAVSVAIPRNGEFVSICTSEGCAVFHSPQELRDLAKVLEEAAELFEHYRTGQHHLTDQETDRQ